MNNILSDKEYHHCIRDRLLQDNGYTIRKAGTYDRRIAMDRELLAKYEKNIFSVMEEVWASNDERVDLVIFLNGLAIMSFELKCNTVGQSYQDAIYQYRVDRDPKTRLFWFKAGCLVNFAMDLEQVYMTTKLAGNATFFLPFNMGNGEGVNAGAGNPTYQGKYSVSYMWEDILTKDTVLDLISKFIFIETKESKDELTGKTKKAENIIFLRYHQLDVIRRLLTDVREWHHAELPDPAQRWLRKNKLHRVVGTSPDFTA